MDVACSPPEIKLTAVVNNDEIHSLIGQPNMTIKQLADTCKAISPTLSNINGAVVIYFNGRILANPNQTLKEYGIGDGDALAVTVVPFTEANHEGLIEMIRSSDQLMSQVRTTNSELWSALNSNDTATIWKMLPALLSAIGFGRAQQPGGNVTSDGRITNQTDMDDINSMLIHAMEHFPETFGVVPMLFIKCKINNFEIVAFVDSGAQATIMSEDFAKRCNLMQLVDKRFEGVALGVGSCRILGRLHVAQLQIEEDFLPVSCFVVENKSHDLLLGLDMLRRHQCLINLKENCLVINGTRTSFLAEHEVPARLRAPREDATGVGDQPHPSASRSRFSEADLTKVCSAGFTRAQAIEAMERTNGNVKKAVAMLVVKYLDKP